MKIEDEGVTLRVAGIEELGAGNAHLFRDEVRAALKPGQANIEVDLSDTTFIDSSGLGALIALHKTACNRKGGLRLLNPQPPVAQILQLTRMNQIFEIVKAS
jgi:anti-sigma B factor antagonist